MSADTKALLASCKKAADEITRINNQNIELEKEWRGKQNEYQNKINGLTNEMNSIQVPINDKNAYEKFDIPGQNWHAGRDTYFTNYCNSNSRHGFPNGSYRVDWNSVQCNGFANVYCWAKCEVKPEWIQTRVNDAYRAKQEKQNQITSVRQQKEGDTLQTLPVTQGFQCCTNISVTAGSEVTDSPISQVNNCIMNLEKKLTKEEEQKAAQQQKDKEAAAIQQQKAEELKKQEEQDKATKTKLSIMAALLLCLFSISASIAVYFFSD